MMSAMSAPDATRSPADAAPNPSPRPTLATASFVTGLLAVVVTFGALLLPLIASLLTTDGWSQLGYGLMGYYASRALTALLAIGAVITGSIALRRHVGRARAGAGVALGAVLLLELIVDVSVLAQVVPS